MAKLTSVREMSIKFGIDEILAGKTTGAQITEVIRVYVTEMEGFEKKSIAKHVMADFFTDADFLARYKEARVR